MIQIFYPRKGKYLFYCLGHPGISYTGDLRPYYVNPVLAIPLDVEPHIEQVDVDVFVQGNRSSYDGQTEVHHLKVKGDIEINPFIHAGEWAKYQSLHNSKALSVPSWEADNRRLLKSPSNEQEFDEWPLRLSTIRLDTKWRDEDGYIHKEYPLRAYIFGFRRSGKCVYSSSQTWSHFVETQEIEWSTRRIPEDASALSKELFRPGQTLWVRVTHRVVNPDNSDYPAGRNIPREKESDGGYATSICQNEEVVYLGSRLRQPETALEGEEILPARTIHPYFAMWKFAGNGNLLSSAGDQPWETIGPVWIDRLDWDVSLPNVSFISEKLMSDFAILEKRMTGHYTGSRYSEDGGKYAVDRGGITIWQSMMEEALSNMKELDINIYTFILDLLRAKSDWQSLADQFKGDAEYLQRTFAKSAKHEGVSFKDLGANVSNTYLPILYGWRLTQQEAEQIGEALSKVLIDGEALTGTKYLDTFPRTELVTANRGTGLSFFNGSVTFAYKAALRPQDNPFSVGVDTLKSYGLSLDLTDAWDMIKYSFVVDWVLDVGGWLNTIDNYAWTCNLDVLSVTKSQKYEGHVYVEDYLTEAHFLGNPAVLLDVSYYHRWIEKKLDPAPIWSFSVKGPSGLLNHIPEGTALVVQRL